MQQLTDRFDEALILLRRKAELGQAELAERSGLSKSLISSYETAKAVPSLPSLEKLLAALDADRFDLANALQAVRGQPLLEFRVLEPGEAPRHEIFDLLDLDLPPKLQKVFLSALAVLCESFTGAVPESLSPVAEAPGPRADGGMSPRT